MKKQQVKRLTLAQWRAVFNAVSESYYSSYAMMVDDAMEGFKPLAGKYGLGAFWDGEVFQFIFARVKGNRPLDEQDCEELEYFREVDR